MSTQTHYSTVISNNCTLVIQILIYFGMAVSEIQAKAVLHTIRVSGREYV